MMPMLSSMAPLHSLAQGNQIEMQHDVMPLTSELHDAHGMVSGTTVFLR